MGSSVILPAPGQPKEGPDPNFVVGSTPAFATFALRDIGPPSMLYLKRDDALLLVASSLIGTLDTVTFNWRQLLAPLPRGGQPDLAPTALPLDPRNSNVIEPGSVTISPTGVANVPAQRIDLAEGYLLSISAISLNANYRGQTFALAAIVRGGASIQSSRMLIFADYVTKFQHASWPGGRIVNPAEGPGQVLSTQVGNPAAGADWTFTVPFNTRLRLQSFNAQLVAANAGTPRAVELIIDDGANVIFRIAANATQAINTTGLYTAGSLGTPSTIVATDFQINLPGGLMLADGWRLRTNTVNINAADQWSNIWLGVEQWHAIT